VLHKFTYSIVAIVLSISSTSCSLLKKEPIPKAVPLKFPKASEIKGQQPRQMGKITMVNEIGQFVLVELGAGAVADSGSTLKCMRNGTETGTLKVSPERRGKWIAADIVSGTPSLGDEVLQ
jgi:hypothetical protein